MNVQPARGAAPEVKGNPVLSVPDACKYLGGISRRTLYRFAAEGLIEIKRLGRTPVVSLESLAHLIDTLPASTIKPDRRKHRGAGEK